MDTAEKVGANWLRAGAGGPESAGAMRVESAGAMRADGTIGPVLPCGAADRALGALVVMGCSYAFRVEELDSLEPGPPSPAGTDILLNDPVGGSDKLVIERALS